jgi:predicted nicotinamide N-methyase
VRVVVQRVSQASVTISGEVVARIDVGLLVLVGVEHEDGEEDAAWLASKLVQMRIFSDEEGKMNRSVVDAGAEVLVADPGRAYLPTAGLAEIARYDVPTDRDLEDRDVRTTRVLRVVALGQQVR